MKNIRKKNKPQSPKHPQKALKRGYTAVRTRKKCKKVCIIYCGNEKTSIFALRLASEKAAEMDKKR